MHRVSMVEYQNTLPFLYGLQHHPISKELNITLEVPSQTALHFAEEQCKIALVPVFALRQLSDYRIFSDFCIGADNPVQTVALYSSVPIEKVQKIHLDTDSLTSIHLAKILAREYWQISPCWTTEPALAPGDCQVAIGDKTFELDDKYAYKYDLAEAWQQFTGLPFTFAVWIAKSTVEKSFLTRFNDALQLGINNLPVLIEQYPQLKTYWTYHISYNFTEEKQKAMNLYLDRAEKIVPLQAESKIICNS